MPQNLGGDSERDAGAQQIGGCNVPAVMNSQPVLPQRGQKFSPGGPEVDRLPWNSSLE
jgi:hypothetical protein